MSCSLIHFCLSIHAISADYGIINFVLHTEILFLQTADSNNLLEICPLSAVHAFIMQL